MWWLPILQLLPTIIKLIADAQAKHSTEMMSEAELSDHVEQKQMVAEMCKACKI